MVVTEFDSIENRSVSRLWPSALPKRLCRDDEDMSRRNSLATLGMVLNHQSMHVTTTSGTVESGLFSDLLFLA